MIKLRKSRPATFDQVDNAAAVPLDEPTKGAPPASGGRFEQDWKEGASTGPVAVIEPTRSAGLKPPGKPSKRARRGGRSSSSESLLGVERPVQRPVAPDNSLIEKQWRGYQGETVSEEDLRALELEYQDLCAFYDGVCEDHQELRLRALQLEQAALAPNSPGSDIVLKGRGEYEADGSGHRERVGEYEQAAKAFALDLLPTMATLHPKRNRVKNRIIKKLNGLPELDRADTTFISVYSQFIQDYGPGAGEESGLDEKMNALEIQLGSVQFTRSRLESQRAQCEELLTTPLDVTALKQLLARMEFIEKGHKAYAGESRDLARAGKALVDLIIKASVQKDDAIALIKKVNARKPTVRGRLQPSFKLVSPNNEFEQIFRDLRTLMGPQAALGNGCQGACDVLRDLYADNVLTRQYIKRVAEDLGQEIDSAESMTALESIEHRIDSLGGDVDVFMKNHARFDAEVARFKESVLDARESHHRVILAKRVEEAMARFRRTPSWEVPGERISKAYEALKETTDPGTVVAVWREDYRQIQMQLRFLCGSALTVSGLEGAIKAASKKRPSAVTVKQLEEDVQRHRALVGDLNAGHSVYLRQAEEFLERISSHKATPPGFSPNAIRLLGALRGHPYGLFHLVRMGTFTVDGAEGFAIPVADRVAVLNQLAMEFPEQLIQSKSRRGDNLLHAVVKNNDITEYEKIEIVRCLVHLGVPQNEYDQDRKYALDRVLGGDRREPELIGFLQRAGARLSPRKGFPVTAHFIGMGGSVSLPGEAEPMVVSLEGLSPRMAQFFLDPVVEDCLARQVARAAPSIKGALEVVSRAYCDLRNKRKFINVLYQGKAAEKGERFGPVILATGWTEPDGHAIGFVFNQELDGSYLYACNTGDSKDPIRSIVKYRVEDFDLAVEFFRGCERDGERTRDFYTGDPARFGFKRCEKKYQIPDRIDKSSQKRGNCPMASRKACLLAALWSTSRDGAVSPEEVRATYKEITSMIRDHGVTQVMGEGSMEMMGKALVSMVTKFDRPTCKESAHRLADEILRVDSKRPRSRRELQAGTEPIPSDPVARIKSALQITKQDIGAMTTRHGESLSAHAYRKGHPEAGALLRALRDAKEAGPSG